MVQPPLWLYLLRTSRDAVCGTFVRRQVTGGEWGWEGVESEGGGGRAGTDVGGTRMRAGLPLAGALGAGGEARWDPEAPQSGASSVARTRAESPKVSVHAWERGGNWVGPRGSGRWSCAGLSTPLAPEGGGLSGSARVSFTSPWKPQVVCSFNVP